MKSFGQLSVGEHLWNVCTTTTQTKIYEETQLFPSLDLHRRWPNLQQKIQCHAKWDWRTAQFLCEQLYWLQTQLLQETLHPDDLWSPVKRKTQRTKRSLGDQADLWACGPCHLFQLQSDMEWCDLEIRRIGRFLKFIRLKWLQDSVFQVSSGRTMLWILLVFVTILEERSWKNQ